MKILVVGKERETAEFKEKFQTKGEFLFFNDYSVDESLIEGVDIIFDFIGEKDSSDAERLFFNKENLTVFYNVPKTVLTRIGAGAECVLFGFNGLPTMINRPTVEVSLNKSEDKQHLDDVCRHLETEYEVVEDRIGMVTPRIICMIINEAFFTLEEGTASVEDIDKAMQLGTNYPNGPFAWKDKMGIKNVYEVLKAVFEETKDERYRICPLLEREYLDEINSQIKN